jgi:hypothetical protein
VGLCRVLASVLSMSLFKALGQQVLDWPAKQRWARVTKEDLRLVIGQQDVPGRISDDDGVRCRLKERLREHRLGQTQ